MQQEAVPPAPLSTPHSGLSQNQRYQQQAQSLWADTGCNIKSNSEQEAGRQWTREQEGNGYSMGKVGYVFIRQRTPAKCY